MNSILNIKSNNSQIEYTEIIVAALYIVYYNLVLFIRYLIPSVLSVLSVCHFIFKHEFNIIYDVYF